MANTVLETYTQTPTITVRKIAGAPSGLTDGLRNITGVGTIGVHITTPAVTSPPLTAQDYYWGTAALARFAHLEADKYTPALDGFGAIVRDGLPGAPSLVTDVSFTIANKVLGRFDLPPEDIADSLYMGRFEGAEITVRAFVESPHGVWEVIVLFAGVVQEAVLAGNVVEFRAGNTEATGFEIPLETIDESSMIYSDTLSEGALPEGESGAVAPLCYGRMGIQALDHRHDTLKVPIEEQWAVSRGFVLAPMVGIKVPMVPVPTLADFHQKALGSATFSEARHILFSLGSTAGAEALPWWQWDESEGPDYIRGLDAYLSDPDHEPLFPPEGEYARNPSTTHKLKWAFLFTWDNELAVARPYTKDFSDDQKTAPYFTDENEFAGVWDYYQTFGANAHTVRAADRNARHHVHALERNDPDWAKISTDGNPGWWTGLAQSVVLVGARLTQIATVTSGIPFGTSAGCLNPERAIDGRPNSYATIPLGERLGIQMPSDITPRGEAIAARLIVIGQQNLGQFRIAFRHTPAIVMGTSGLAEWNCIPGGGSSYVNVTPNKGFSTIFLWTPDTHQSTYAPNGRRPRWEMTERHTSDLDNSFAGDIVIWPAAGTSSLIYGVFLEMIFRPSLAEDRDRVDPRFPIQRAFTGVRVSRLAVRITPGASNLLEQEEDVPNAPTTFATGVWGVDQTGRYNPDPTHRVIENPASIIMHAIDYYRDEYANLELGFLAFGSFLNAIIELNNLVPDYTHFDAGFINTNWRLAVIQTQRIGFQAFLDEVARHAMAFTQRHVTADGTPIWRMFVDKTTPTVSEFWRSDTEITPNDVIGEVRVLRSPKSLIRNRFVLRYGMHLPTGKFAHTISCNDTGSSFVADSALYTQACADSRASWQVDREAKLQLPWLWQHRAAEEWLKWQVDQLLNPRVSVVLPCGQNMLDIEVGHFVRLSDEFTAGIGSYPGVVDVDGPLWSGHKFRVVSKTIRYEGDLIQVDLVLTERWVRPT